MSETDVSWPTVTATNYYVYNVSCNMMALYNVDDATSPAERYLYGSEKTGVYRGPNVLGALPSMKDYEIHDHLGNVRAVVDAEQDPTAEAIVKRYFSYYAFGSQ